MNHESQIVDNHSIELAWYMIASGIYYLSTFALTMILTASNAAGSVDNDNRTVASDS